MIHRYDLNQFSKLRVTGGDDSRTWESPYQQVPLYRKGLGQDTNCHR